MSGRENLPCLRDLRLLSSRVCTFVFINKNSRKPGWLIRSRWKSFSYKSGQQNRGKLYLQKTMFLGSTSLLVLAPLNRVPRSISEYVCTRKASREWRRETGSVEKSRLRRTAEKRKRTFSSHSSSPDTIRAATEDTMSARKRN